MTYVVGALGSRPAASRGMGRRGGARGAAPREPRGKRHAVDDTSGVAACGTIDTLQLFPEEQWGPVGEWCVECEERVPFD